MYKKNPVICQYCGQVVMEDFPNMKVFCQDVVCSRCGHIVIHADRKVPVKPYVPYPIDPYDWPTPTWPQPTWPSPQPWQKPWDWDNPYYYEWYCPRPYCGDYYRTMCHT